MARIWREWPLESHRSSWFTVGTQPPLPLLLPPGKDRRTYGQATAFCRLGNASGAIHLNPILIIWVFLAGSLGLGLRLGSVLFSALAQGLTLKSFPFFGRCLQPSSEGRLLCQPSTDEVRTSATLGDPRPPADWEYERLGPRASGGSWAQLVEGSLRTRCSTRFK